MSTNEFSSSKLLEALVIRQILRIPKRSLNHKTEWRIVRSWFENIKPILPRSDLNQIYVNLSQFHKSDKILIKFRKHSFSFLQIVYI